MAGNGYQDHHSTVGGDTERPSTTRIALALAAVTAVGLGLVVQQIMDRRLSKPVVTRLKFYRYLRERGHLES